MPYLNDRFHAQNTVPATAPPSGGKSTGTFDAAAIAARIAGRIIGQDPAVEAVHRALTLAQAGVQDRERPLASILLVGQTGVGKTELVRRLAAELRDGPDDLCRVDMSQLAQEHYAAAFAGAPPGYAGSKEGISVFDRDKVEGGPLTPGIVLCDEVEKAHTSVLRALLGVLDRGTLRLANGQQTIDFRNSFVFLTSNLGSRELARRRGATWRTALERPLERLTPADLGGRVRSLLARTEDGVVDRAVRRFFDPEFLNRLDDVVHFHELSTDSATRITELELGDAVDRLRRRGMEVAVGPGAVRALRHEGFDPVLGARSLRRVVRHRVLAAAADELVGQRARGIERPSVRIDADAGGEVVVRATDPAP